MRSCNGLCHDKKAILDGYLFKVHKIGWYRQGFKRCNKCEEFLDKRYQNKCPCCGMKLRGRPSDPASKRQFLELGIFEIDDNVRYIIS